MLTSLQLSQTSPTPSPSTSRCPGFAILGQLSSRSNTESPSASWLEIEFDINCWAFWPKFFGFVFTCTHLQHCQHRCPSGRGLVHEDNCHRHRPHRHLMHNSESKICQKSTFNPNDIESGVFYFEVFRRGWGMCTGCCLRGLICQTGLEWMSVVKLN